MPYSQSQYKTTNIPTPITHMVLDIKKVLDIEFEESEYYALIDNRAQLLLSGETLSELFKRIDEAFNTSVNFDYDRYIDNAEHAKQVKDAEIHMRLQILSSKSVANEFEYDSDYTRFTSVYRGTITELLENYIEWLV